ncbi:MAG TPA: O-methyltransferase [Candidatus Limnocylindria bacterium]|nr:O-methyltransferase [Candidatus Limnocylindria bacterium]
MERAASGLRRIPILSRDSGRVLAVLAANRRRIVEVGTAIGYSTLWMALGMPSDGTIVTIDPDESRTNRAREHWRTAGVPDDRITVVNRPALEAFDSSEAALRGPFDLAFIDALKEEYQGYLDALRPRLTKNATVVADNVLWGGRTSGARPATLGDGTQELRDFCARISADPAFETAILPLGDGLLVATLRA